MASMVASAANAAGVHIKKIAAMKTVSAAEIEIFLLIFS
jgi:hypothetical protein